MYSRYTLHDANYAQSVRRELVCDVLKTIHGDTKTNNNFSDYRIWFQNAETLKMEIDKRYSAEKSDPKTYFIKTASLFVLCSDNPEANTFQAELSQKAAEMIESFRMDPQGILVYVMALHLSACACVSSGVFVQAATFNRAAENAINDFKAIAQFSPKGLPQMEDLVLSQLYNTYERTHDAGMQVKYGVLLIQRAIQQSDHEISFHALSGIQTYICKIIELRHFAQTNYLLVALMSELEKRELVAPGGVVDRGAYMDMDACKDLMATFFASWAVSVIKYSLNVKIRVFDEIEPISGEVLTIPELAVQQNNYKYDKEFPLQAIERREDFEKYLKRGQEWAEKVNKWKKMEFLNELRKLESDAESYFSKLGWKRWCGWLPEDRCKRVSIV